VCARAIPADPRSPCPCPCPCPCPSPLPHPPVRPFSILRRPLLFPRDPRRGADRPDRPDCRDVFCIELTKCTSRIFIAPTNIAGRGRVTDARLHFGKNTRKNTGKGNPPLLAARNPDEGPRRFLPPPHPPPPSSTDRCVSGAQCVDTRVDPAICKSVCLSLPVLPLRYFM